MNKYPPGQQQQWQENIRRKQMLRPNSQSKEPKQLPIKQNGYVQVANLMNNTSKVGQKRLSGERHNMFQLRQQHPMPMSTQTTYRYSPYLGIGKQQQRNDSPKIKLPMKGQQYNKVSQSLNGSFELQRRHFTNLDASLNGISTQMTMYKPQRAQSVMEDYSKGIIEMQSTLKIPRPIVQERIIPFDSETSFEGYRQGDPRFLTLTSSQDDHILEDYNVRDFLSSQKLGHYMLKHFVEMLDGKQIEQLEQYVKIRKRQLKLTPQTSQRNKSKVFK